MIANPFVNALFVPVAQRLLFVLLAGFGVVVVFNVRTLSGMFSSDAWIRYRSWLIIAPLFMVAIFLGRYSLVVLVTLLAFLALSEFSRMAALRERYRVMLLGLAVFTMGVTLLLRKYFLMLPLAYFLVTTVVAILENNPKKAFSSAAQSLFAAVWINFSLAHVLLLAALPQGEAVLLALALSIGLSDVGAYCVGRALAALHFDKPKIADKISPNKTYLGISGHVLGAWVGLLVMWFALPWLSLKMLLLFGAVIGVSDSIGGFTLSMIKRSFGVKDAGSLIPGHGGILDRIDSLLRVAVVSYYLLLVIL